MHRAKRALWFAVIFAVAFLFFDKTTIVDRGAYRVAFTAYVRNPTPENEIRWRSKGRKNELVKAWDAAIEAAIVTGFAIGVFAIYRLVRGRHKTRE